MNAEERTVKEFLQQKIRLLKMKIENDVEELKKLESALSTYEGKSQKIVIQHSLTRVTFASQIRRLLKEIDKPTQSNELRRLYNSVSGKEEMPSNRFASRMVTSKKRGKFQAVTGLLHIGERNFWVLDEWFGENGWLLPKYQEELDRIVAKDEEEHELF